MVVKAFCFKNRAVHFSLAIKKSPLLSAHNSIYHTAKIHIHIHTMSDWLDSC